MCLAVFVVLCCFSRATASTFVISNLDDNAATVGSLRWAVAQANNHANNAGDPTDTIEFDPAFFNVARTITLTNGQLHLTDASGATIITGPGEDLLTISGNGASRVFLVDQLFQGTAISPAGVVVKISDLTIADGHVGATPFGGGIHNSGVLTLTRVAVSNCVAEDVSTVRSVNALGGGVFNYGTLTVDECSFVNNTAHAQTANLEAEADGGAICIWSTGTLTATGSEFSGNAAIALETTGGGNFTTWGYGGAIENIGTATLATCSFSSNSVDSKVTLGGSPAYAYGGAVHSSGTLTAISNCVVRGNTLSARTGGYDDAEAYGGGLDITASTPVTDTVIEGNTAAISDTDTGYAMGGGVFGSGVFRGCTVSGNTASALANSSATAYGGGAWGGMTFVNSAINSNTATATATAGAPSTAFGGGIYTSGNLNLLNSTVVGNLCTAGGTVGITLGGAVYQSSGSITLGNSTVVANSAESEGASFGQAQGGGIYGSATMGNSILSGNLVSAVAAGPTLNGPNLYGTATSQGHNLIGDPSDATGFVSSDQTGVDPLSIFEDVDSSGTIDANDLAGNGGPTDNLALKPGGPAVDAGDDAIIPDDPDTMSPLTTDQRGPGFPRIEFAAVDVGAYELGPAPAPLLSITPAGPGQATISWTPDTGTNWVLQETLSLSPANWSSSPSGSTNPIVVPATLPAKFYRLFKP